MTCFVDQAWFSLTSLIQEALLKEKMNTKRHISKKGATLGANCTIICGNTVGSNAFVAAGAVITKNVPAFALMAGVPAKQIGWMCECGVKLKFNQETDQSTTCKECSSTYTLQDGQLSRQ